MSPTTHTLPRLASLGSERTLRPLLRVAGASLRSPCAPASRWARWARCGLAVGLPLPPAVIIPRSAGIFVRLRGSAKRPHSHENQPNKNNNPLTSCFSRVRGDCIDYESFYIGKFLNFVSIVPSAFVSETMEKYLIFVISIVESLSSAVTIMLSSSIIQFAYISDVL